MLWKYSAPFLVAVALVAPPLAAQAPPGRVFPTQVRPVRPVQPSEARPGVQLRQPSNLDLQLMILELSRQVEALTAQVAEMNTAQLDRIAQADAARRDQIQGLANSLSEFRHLERERFGVTMQTAFNACIHAAFARGEPGQALQLCRSDEWYWPGQSLLVD